MSSARQGAPCIRCGADGDVGRFCPHCGANQTPPPPRVDALIGTTVADRYTIVELLGVGGMARVYRAKQRLLDRDVALKLIHPELLMSEDSVPRFIAEARAASRLNHPNVVSIFDFGLAAGHQAYLVMELLAGTDLATLLVNEGPLPFARVADILRQVLAALHEAHELGVTHRDIKPENIFVERARGGEDRVKVIDFGIAKAAARAPTERRLTQQGQLVGTPHYMAPEQVLGETGPSVDLYAVGVCLFEMLTGSMPFEGETATAILNLHAKAARPDPRVIAPNRAIPAALAELCMRAIDVDPARRLPSAQALAQAITTAATEAWTPLHATLFPSRSPSVSPGVKAVYASTQPPAVDPADPVLDGALESDELPLVGRSDDLTWGQALLRVPQGVRGIVYFGGPGMGRSRLVRELGASMRVRGARVVHVPAHGPPAWEVGYAWLRRAITSLAGAKLDDTHERGDVAAGLRAIFARDIPAGTDPAAVRRSAGAALAWAASCATDAQALRSNEASDGPATPRAHNGADVRALVLLVIDDVDLLDSASQLVLGDFLLSRKNHVAALRVVMTSEECPETTSFECLQAREVGGLSAADATSLLGGKAAGRENLEPLYLAQIRRWRAEGRTDDPPPRLSTLVEWRMRVVPLVQRRLLQALATVGTTSMDTLASILLRPEDIDDALEPLVAAGFVVARDGVVAFTHTLFSRIALQVAPAGALADLRARAADALAEDPDVQELRAHLAILGRPDFEAFFLLEETARLRTNRGDDEGAIAALYDGVRAARAQIMLGEAESAASAMVVFSCKLGEALVNGGRADEAYGVVSEALSIAEPSGMSRVLVHEQLARACDHRNRPAEAQRHRELAAGIAELCGDPALVARLKAPPAEARPPTGVRRRTVFQRRSSEGFMAPVTDDAQERSSKDHQASG